MRRGNATKGFTLIELLIVVAIIAIIAIIAIPRLRSSWNEAKEASTPPAATAGSAAPTGN